MNSAVRLRTSSWLVMQLPAAAVEEKVALAAGTPHLQQGACWARVVGGAPAPAPPAAGVLAAAGLQAHPSVWLVGHQAKNSHLSSLLHIVAQSSSVSAQQHGGRSVPRLGGQHVGMQARVRLAAAATASSRTRISMKSGLRRAFQGVVQCFHSHVQSVGLQGREGVGSLRAAPGVCG